LPINLHFRKRCINCLFIAILWEKYPIWKKSTFYTKKTCCTSTSNPW